MDTKRFIQQRKKLGLSQVALSQGICTQSTLSKFENNGQVPSLSILMQLCDHLGLSIDDLNQDKAAIKRVRALCGVDLTAIVELDKDNNPDTKLLEQLSCDPVLLVDVLYAVCKTECDQKGVTDEDFGMAMGGDAVEHATTALLDEIIDFFPAPKRLAFQKILSATRRFEEIARKRLDALMADGEFENKMVSALEQLTGLSGKAPESAE